MDTNIIFLTNYIELTNTIIETNPITSWKEPSLWGAIISSIIMMITAYLMYKSNETSKESVKEMKKQTTINAITDYIKEIGNIHHANTIKIRQLQINIKTKYTKNIDTPQVFADLYAELQNLNFSIASERNSIVRMFKLKYLVDSSSVDSFYNNNFISILKQYLPLIDIYHEILKSSIITQDVSKYLYIQELTPDILEFITIYNKDIFDSYDTDNIIS